MSTIYRFASADITFDERNAIAGNVKYPVGTKFKVLYCFISDKFVSGVGVLVEDPDGNEETICASILVTEELLTSQSGLEQSNMSKISDELSQFKLN